MSFNASVLFCFLLFIYCLGDLSIDLSGMSKFPAIIVLLSVFLFMSVNICFIYSHSYLGRVCYIFFLDWSLDHYVMSIPVQSLTCWCVDCILRLQGCDFFVAGIYPLMCQAGTSTRAGLPEDRAGTHHILRLVPVDETRSWSFIGGSCGSWF